MSATVGSKAPDFTLKTKTDKGLEDGTLSSYQGKQNVLLLFFPLAYTGVCTQEMCEVRDGLKEYQNLNAQVFGISVDSPFAQEAWATQNKIGITLASDLNKKTATDYGVLLPDLAGFGAVSARAAFVVDKAGVVQYSEQTATVKDLPNFAAVKEVLAKLQ